MQFLANETFLVTIQAERQSPRHFTHNNGAFVTYRLAPKESAGDFWAAAEQVPSPAVLPYLRFDPISPEEPAQFVLSLLKRVDIKLIGKLTTATRDTVPQRPLSFSGLH